MNEGYKKRSIIPQLNEHSNISPTPNIAGISLIVDIINKQYVNYWYVNYYGTRRFIIISRYWLPV